MCGRYFFNPEGWNEMLGELQRKYGEQAQQMAQGEIFPSQWVAVKANDRRQRPGWFLMQWGFKGFKGSQRLINARVETAAQKPTFGEAMACRRCLIPAQGYYEWEQHQLGKQKYALEPVNEEFAYLAGLYRHEENGPALVILTREAAPGIRHIHHRMPVILREKDAAQWLAPGYISPEWLEWVAVKEITCQPMPPAADPAQPGSAGAPGVQWPGRE